MPFRIIGMFSQYESEATTRDVFHTKNHALYMPLNTMLTKLMSGAGTNGVPDTRLSTIDIRVPSVELLEPGIQQARNVLLMTHKGLEDFSFRTQVEKADDLEAFIRNARISGGIIAAIALLAGGVGIMNPQSRGTSDLVRSADGISMNLDTTDLPVRVVTMWWAIFNNPSECSDGQCHHLLDTGRGGTPNPAEGTVLWATSGIVGPDRMGHFSASLGVGLEDAPGQVLRGPSLTNPMGAEVHWIIKYHGPTMWDDLETLSLQMTNVRGNCDNFPCYDPQRAIHKP